MGFRPVVADRLALVLDPAQQVDQRPPEDEAEDQRREESRPRPEGDVAEQVEHVAAVGQGGQPVEHPLFLAVKTARLARRRRRQRRARLFAALEPLTSTTSPASPGHRAGGQLLGVSAQAPRWLGQGLVQVAHPGTDAMDEIDLRHSRVIGQPGAARSRPAPVPACRPGSRPAPASQCGQRGKARRHRGRVGVEGVVDQAQARQVSAHRGPWAAASRPGAWRPLTSAPAAARGEDAQRVRREMPPVV